MPNRKIADVIRNQQILTAEPGLTVSEAASQMSRNHVGAIMVVADERLIGIFTERDALNRVLAANRHADEVTLAEVMTPDPATMTPDRPLGHALHLMYEGGYRHVPIVEAGRPVGMVSARDALGAELVDFEGELARREEINRLL